jgi:hypothetical protein
MESTQAAKRPLYAERKMRILRGRLWIGFFQSNTLVWVLLSVMFACLVLWALTGTILLPLDALLVGLGALYIGVVTTL